MKIESECSAPPPKEPTEEGKISSDNLSSSSVFPLAAVESVTPLMEAGLLLRASPTCLVVPLAVVGGGETEPGSPDVPTPAGLDEPISFC